MSQYSLNAYDPQTNERTAQWNLPGFTEEDVRTMFELSFEDDADDLFLVGAGQRSDLQIVVGDAHRIDLNLYTYYVEPGEDVMDQAVRIMSDMIEAADYLRQGGALDSLSHAPDGGEKWHNALAAAEAFVETHGCSAEGGGA